MKKSVLFSLIAVFIFFLLKLCHVDIQYVQKTQPFELPSVSSLKSFDGQEIVLPKKPFFMLFITTRCPYCKMMHLFFKKEKTPYPIVAVLMEKEAQEAVLEFFGNNHPYAVLAVDEENVWKKALRIVSIPEMFFIKENKVFARISGMFNQKGWKDKILPAMKEFDNDIQK